MRDIVVRTLRREFRIAGQPEAPLLRYVEARPAIDRAAVVPQIVNIESNQEFFRARLPSGRSLEGTLRYVTEHLDYFVEYCARADEADAVSLPAALLVSPDGQRVLFAGGRKSGKTTLALGLLSSGWRFEGTRESLSGRTELPLTRGPCGSRSRWCGVTLASRISSTGRRRSRSMAWKRSLPSIRGDGDGNGALPRAKSTRSSFSKTPIWCFPRYAASVQTKPSAALCSFSPRPYPSRRGMFRCCAPLSPLPACFIWSWSS